MPALPAVCRIGIVSAIAVPDGWAEHKEASQELGVQMLAPKGQSFDEAPAKIYALVRYNPAKQPVAEIVLSANTKAAFSAAESAYMSILKAY